MDECVRVLDSMPERNPTDGTFELTIRCNLHCKMCLFRHDDSENAEIKSKELTAGQWIDMARQAAEAGTLSLLITGGEPLLRPDFCEIWEGIYKQGFVITLYTNATLVTDKVMETLRKYPPHRIGVTIYGASPETYEMVTGNAGAFQMTMEGIKQLMTLPSRMEYRMTVIKDNCDDVPAVEDIVYTFDPEATLINTELVTKAVRGACANVEACRLAPGMYFQLSLDRAVRSVKKKAGEKYSQGILSIRQQEKECKSSQSEGSPTLFGCNAGMSSYTVSWDGKLLGCQVMGSFAREINGNMAAAWEAFPFGISLPPVDKKCLTCSMKENCSLCPAFRYAETGSFSDAPEYICANTRAEAKLIKELKNKRIIKRRNNP